MHLFDSPWPSRPTFGINLQKADELHGSQQTYLPRSGSPRSHAIDTLGQFGGALFDTMHNWVDITQLTLPAYRGRVAEVRLKPEEGGMNLTMPPDLVLTLAERGKQAAELFDDFDLAAHKKARFEASMAAFDDLITTLHAAARASFDDTIDAAVPKSREEAADRLVELGWEWEDGATPHPGAQGNIPRPEGDLRIVPRQ